MSNTEQAVRRLPIFGESRWDRALRDLRDVPAFGTWLCANYRDVPGFVDAIDSGERSNAHFDVVWAIDRVEDPEGLTLGECEDLFLEVEENFDASELAAWDSIILAWAKVFNIRGQETTTHRCRAPATAARAPKSGGVYFIRQGEEGPIKIGQTRNVRARMQSLQTGSPYPLLLLALLPGAAREEAELHDRVAAHSLTGEWFKPEPELLAFARDADGARR